MRRTSLFLMLCILGSVFTDSTHLAQILKLDTEYEKVISDTVNLQLKMGSDVHTIIGMLREMKAQFELDLQSAKDRYMEEQNQCMNDIDELEDLIYRSEFDIAKYTQFLIMDNDILEDRQADQIRLTEEMGRLREFETSLNAERQTQLEKHLASQAEHDQVRDVIHQAKIIINERLRPQPEGSPAFLEKSEGPTAFIEVSNLLEGFSPYGDGVSKNFNELFIVVKMMVQRAPVQSDQDMVDTLMRILDDLLENLDRSWDIEMTAERQRQQAYDENNEYLQGLISYCDERLTKTTSEIGKLTIQIQQQEDHLAMQKDNFENGDQNLRDQRAQCTQLRESFEAAKNNFNEQIRVLRETIFILEANQEQLANERYSSK